MRRSATGFMKTKKSLRTLSGFGKSWEPGAQNRVFFPIFWNEETQAYEVLAAGCWGHNADYENFPLKSGFIRSNCVLDDYGKPIGTPDLAYQFSRIARTFIVGEHMEEKKKLESSKMPEPAKYEKYAELEKKYNPKEQSSVKPVVRALDLKIATEVAVVPLNNGVPDVAKAGNYSLDLSNTRIENINKILRDPKYKPEGTDATFIEVEYSYALGEKKDVGKTEAAGITQEYKLSEKYPSEWEKILKGPIEALPFECEEIENRNFSFRKVSNSDVAKAISEYVYMNTDKLTMALTDEKQEEIIISNSAILKQLKLLEVVENEAIVARIEAELNGVDTETETDNDEKLAAPTVQDLISKNADKIQTDDELEDSYEVAV